VNFADRRTDYHNGRLRSPQLDRPSLFKSEGSIYIEANLKSIYNDNNKLSAIEYFAPKERFPPYKTTYHEQRPLSFDADA
jgi:hypothetical protein